MITPNLTILHVDDDAENRMSLGWVLRAEGFGLLQAANGAEALRLARRQPDIILLDVRLPDLDGFEVCRRLKADPATMAIPVLQLSGHYTSRDDRVHGLEGGADGFLAKPVEPRELLAHIWALIRVHRAERAALAAAAEWQTTFDAVGDGVCLLDHQGKVRRCNQAMARILDMEAEDVVDAQLVDLVRGLPPATAELPGPIEFTLRGRWYSIRVTPVVNERHERTGSVQVWTEITGRRTAEEALRRREQEFHSLADHMPAMIARVDAGLHHLYVNPAVAAVTGIAAQAFQGKTARELGLPEEVVAFWEDHLRQAFAGGEELSAEFAYPTPHGPRYFQSRLVPERSEVGTVETVLCISHDVTELRQAVEERDRFFTQSLNLLCVASFDGFFRRLNPAWETTLGFTREELLARPIVDFVHPDDRESTLKEVAKLARGGTTTSFEIRCRCKDRSYKWLLWNATPFLDQRGFYATGHDITERKRLEEQFRQAQKMEAIGLLAGGVAHDFNNLLTIIAGYSELLLMHRTADDPATEPLREIRKAGERAAALTRQLLAFSRKQILHTQPLDLNKLVCESEKMFRRLIGEDIDFACFLAPDLGLIKADAGQLEQVLLNLVVNARDAMPTGGHVTLETQNVDLDSSYAQQHTGVTPGSYVLLAITDTGCGMDEATRVRIFEPFFTTKEAGRGTGLGLATVFGIVKQSGGHIEVYSEMGQGTTFKIYLPRLDPALQSEQASSDSLKAPSGTETILLAEDEDGLRSLARLALQAHGFKVLEARNGQEALDLCENHHEPIHLVVTDVVMPKISGRQLAERLLALRPSLKVLYLSGYTDDAVFRHGVLESGMPFLQKPFTPKTLARKVREVLDG